MKENISDPTKLFEYMVKTLDIFYIRFYRLIPDY